MHTVRVNARTEAAFLGRLIARHSRKDASMYWGVITSRPSNLGYFAYQVYSLTAGTTLGAPESDLPRYIIGARDCLAP